MPSSTSTPSASRTAIQSKRTRRSTSTFETDADLVTGLLDDDPAAWRTFQRDYDRFILRCIMSVVRRFALVVSTEDAREIRSALYVSLLVRDKRKIRSFDPERGVRFSTWLGLLATNAAYDHLRIVRRNPIKDFLSDAIEAVDHVRDPFETTSEREHAQIALTTFAELSARDRAFAALYFVDEMSPPEIASVMKISVNTVYSKKYKIQARLERLLSIEEAPLAA